MADLHDLDFSNDELIEVAHEFAVDLNCVVVANHRFTLEGITRAEDEEVQQWRDALALQDSQVALSAISHVQNGYEELRGAANRLALVGLVTRLQHWIARFIKEQGLKSGKVHESLLISQLDALNRSLGDGPVPLSYFEDLVNVRDSIIHADSRAEWKHRGANRRVADHYRNPWGEIEFSEGQLKDAIEQATGQVTWYDEKLHPQRSA
jgi:hypothetical protein